MKTQLLTTLVAAGVMAGSMTTAFAADPRYKADVPASLITPDTVETKYLGDLKFVDGFPTDATLEMDIYFSPKAPKGKESNWIQTIPGKSWFIALRMYGPFEPWLDKTWRPSELELVG